jgi:hypothetical protein
MFIGKVKRMSGIYTHELYITKDGKKMLVDKYVSSSAASKIKRMIDPQFKPTIKKLDVPFED